MANLADDARVTVAEVQEIIDTDLALGHIAAFINTAHHLVDEYLLNKGLSSDILAEIEKWLAAHFLSMKDQRKSQERMGADWNVVYQGKTDMGLNATLYGQQALVLDTTGSLASTGLKRATFEVHSEFD
jgi:hypothetical protein